MPRPKPSRRRARAALSIVVIALSGIASSGILSCGGSVRAVVESDMRFEHCYRLDEDARISFTDKRRCWASWTTTYAKGQEFSRIHYALDRLAALADVTHEHDTVVVGASSEVDRGPSVVPLSPYRPPPATLPVSKVVLGSPSSVDPARAAVFAARACRDACEHSYAYGLASCLPGTPCGSEWQDDHRRCVDICDLPPDDRPAPATSASAH